jgi:ABC-type oligopeptide transport system ATPase subunit
MEKSAEDCRKEGALPEICNFRIYKHERIYERAVENTTPQERPVAIILGGQPGSGKSTIGKDILDEYKAKGGIAFVEGDALREYHPKFNQYNRENDKLMAVYTASDSSRWSQRLIEDIARNRCNMVVESTLKDWKEVTGMVERFSNAGYEVQIRTIVVSYEKSLLGCYSRYEKPKIGGNGYGRFVPDQTLSAAYTGMPDTLQALKEQGICSGIHLYSREKVLFEGDYRRTDIVGIVNRERLRAYTPEEVDFLRKGWTGVGEMMSARSARKEEFAEISGRMESRIKSMMNEGTAKENVQTMIDIHRDFKRQFFRDFSVSKGVSM